MDRGLRHRHLVAGAAMGQIATNSLAFSVNQNVPDADWNGMAMATNLSGMSGTIFDVSVRLNLTGGYNGRPVRLPDT